jgi:hypothetical protein
MKKNKQFVIFYEERTKEQILLELRMAVANSMPMPTQEGKLIRRLSDEKFFKISSIDEPAFKDENVTIFIDKFHEDEIHVDIKILNSKDLDEIFVGTIEANELYFKFDADIAVDIIEE